MCPAGRREYRVRRERDDLMAGMITHCAACGFDARATPVAHVTAQIGVWGSRVEEEYRDCPPAARGRRPATDRWSVSEYVLHLVHALSTSRWFVEQGLAADRPELTPPDPGESVAAEPAGTDDELAARFGRRVDRLTEVLVSLGPGDYERTIVLGWSRIRGEIGEVPLGDVARNALHELVHHHRDLVDVRRAVGAPAAEAPR